MREPKLEVKFFPFFFYFYFLFFERIDLKFGFSFLRANHTLSESYRYLHGAYLYEEIAKTGYPSHIHAYV